MYMMLENGLKSPYNYANELPDSIPEHLYMHHSIDGYPGFDIEAFFGKMENKDGKPFPKRKMKKYKKSLESFSCPAFSRETHCAITSKTTA